MKLHNKIAIVTGAGQGIGKEICRKLAEAGATVILNDIDTDLTNAAAQELGKNVWAYSGDSSDLKVIEGMVKMAVEQFGRLDMVVANAGITLFGDFFEYTSQAFQQVMQTNLAGTFFLAQTAAKQMKQQANGGTLLFMSSVTGHQAHKNLAAYSMSKAAIEMLARNLVIELSEFKINANCIAPGATTTERTLADADYEKTWSRLTPMGRPSHVQDIAETALFLVSDAAKQITGQSIVVDGGWSVVSPSPY